jgi:hypothetical protein
MKQIEAKYPDLMLTEEEGGIWKRVHPSKPVDETKMITITK